MNKDSENPSAHEMQLTIGKMKKEFEVSRKQSSKKTYEPESMYLQNYENKFYFMNRHEI